MPAVLQLLTIVLIFSLESNAVLAVVVTQTPRIALGSQTGAGGVGVGVGVGGVVPPPVVPDLAQLMQKDSNMARITIRKQLYREKIRLFCMNLG
jgi:hypothetical protein